VTHGAVAIDPSVPVPCWGLSEKGRAQHEAFNRSRAVAGVRSVYCSNEQKARDAAAILSARVAAAILSARVAAAILSARVAARPVVVEALRENDRSATGYLPEPEFQAVADLFFAHPDQSVRGWERAADAQARIVGCVDRILASDRTAGDVAIIAHGGVGALLLCHLLGVPVSRAMDQPGRSGGNYFAFDIRSRRLLHGWRDIATAS